MDQTHETLITRTTQSSHSSELSPTSKGKNEFSWSDKQPEDSSPNDDMMDDQLPKFNFKVYMVKCKSRVQKAKLAKQMDKDVLM